MRLFIFQFFFFVANSPPACDAMNWFECASGGNECVPNIWKCDGDKDCSNGADEKNCPDPTCTELQFLCTDIHNNLKTCFSRTKICDHINDCKNGTDEEDCGE